MSNLAGTDFVHYTPQGVFFYESSSVFTPSLSQSSLPLITQITCSADLGNSLAVTSSLSKFLVIPLINNANGVGSSAVGSGFVVGNYSSNSTTLIPSQLNVIYNTGSFFAISSSNTTNFYQPTSSDTILNYNLNVSIKKNDTISDRLGDWYASEYGIFKRVGFGYLGLGEFYLNFGAFGCILFLPIFLKLIDFITNKIKSYKTSNEIIYLTVLPLFTYFIHRTSFASVGSALIWFSFVIIFLTLIFSLYKFTKIKK